MKKALVILSGGQDSTTCLFWAKSMFDEVHAVTFNYGQRHGIEIFCAAIVAKMANVASHEIIELGSNVLKGTSPLVSDAKLDQYKDHRSLPGGVEKTFVPMRNQLFLTIAANRAFILGCDTMVTGVCEEDFGGYPDCRASFIWCLEDAIAEGTFTGEDGMPGRLKIETPLMNLTKAATVKMATMLDGCMKALAHTHTAYDGKYPPTGKDHASLLRAKGFEEADVADPLVLRAWSEGLMDLPPTHNYDPMREPK